MRPRVNAACDTLTYSPGSAAPLMGLSEATVRRMLDRGELRYGLHPRTGRMRITGRAINQWLAMQAEAAGYQGLPE